MKLSPNIYFGASSKIRDMATELRYRMTGAELEFWSFVSNRKINGYKFRRQHAIRQYIVDFYCHELLLVIEIDGGIHNESEVQIKDEQRENELQSLGLYILRFTNEQVFKTPGDVIKKLEDVVYWLEINKNE